MTKKEVTVMYDLSDFKDFKRQCERVRTNTDIVVMTNPIREYSTAGKFLLDTNINARLLQLSNKKHKSKSEKNLYEL